MIYFFVLMSWIKKYFSHRVYFLDPHSKAGQKFQGEIRSWKTETMRSYDSVLIFRGVFLRVVVFGRILLGRQPRVRVFFFSGRLASWRREHF